MKGKGEKDRISERGTECCERRQVRSHEGHKIKGQWSNRTGKQKEPDVVN